jgi:hypothetical protein
MRQSVLSEQFKFEAKSDGNRSYHAARRASVQEILQAISKDKTFERIFFL